MIVYGSSTENLVIPRPHSGPWESPGISHRTLAQFDEWYREIATSCYALLAMTYFFVARCLLREMILYFCFFSCCQLTTIRQAHKNRLGNQI